MNKNIVFVFLILGIIVIAGCTQEQNKLFNASYNVTASQEIIVPDYFLNLDCDNLIPAQKLNNLIHNDWKWVASKRNNGSEVSLWCYFGPEDPGTKDAPNPRLIISISLGSSRQSPKQFAFLMKTSAQDGDNIAMSDKAGSIYFGYEDYYAGTLAQFVTSNEKWIVSFTINKRPRNYLQKYGYEDIKTITPEAVVEAAKIIDKNLVQLR